MTSGDVLPIAVRAWTDQLRKRRSRRPVPQTRHILVVDTETTIDSRQALTFGCYRYCHIDADGRVVTLGEGLFHADDLAETDPDGYTRLCEYVKNHRAEVDMSYRAGEPDRRLHLMSRAEFVERWLHAVCYKPLRGRRWEPATLVMFNAPFDLSRLANNVAHARGEFFYGGFSLDPWAPGEATDRTPYRPYIRVKSIDSKRSLNGFTEVEQRDKRNRARSSRGHFLDLRTLAFALTGASHSLASASTAFGVEHGKTSIEEHGVITVDYIDYCRRDVHATGELYEKLTTEYARHPIELAATKAFSPASIAKAYLRVMGITPILDRQPDFPLDILGYATSAFYGGRAECHIRNTPVPVVVCDFTSMYPTVDARMNLWPLLTHERVAVVDATDEVRELLDAVTLDHCFRKDLWPKLVGIARIAPDEDVLPVRAAYDRQPGWNIGINPLTSDEPLWYTIADLVAAKLLTGKAPNVLHASRFVAAGEPLSSLTALRLRGEVPVDPRHDDFFRAVVEQRQYRRSLVTTHDDECACQFCSLPPFLKVLANAGSYGIFGEMNRAESPTGTTTPATVYGAFDQPWQTRVSAPESPGEYCFPPIAACITGAARLMLAMLERCVTDLGGTWAFCDTDSMAIVADRDGSLVPSSRDTGSGPTAPIRALRHDQVESIRFRFDALNPYDPKLVPEILKREFDGHAYVISAKRYALYRLDEFGSPILGEVVDDEEVDGDDVSCTLARHDS